MELLTQPAPASARAPRKTEPNDSEASEYLKRTVRAVITRLTPLVAHERRQHPRHPLPLLMELTPVDSTTLEPVGSTIVVVGKSLSESGCGFFHQHAMPYRHAIVRMEAGAGADLCLLVDLAWCRYTRYGWYESGGKFLRVVESSATAG
jgi:hypothetical protein